MPPEQVAWVKAKCANYERDNQEQKTIISTNKTISHILDYFDKNYTEDPIVEAVKQKLTNRSQVGVKKYGTTLADNTKDNYLNHLQQELLDGANYIEVLLQQQKDITQLINKYPNNTELGEIIRKIYGSN